MQRMYSVIWPALCAALFGLAGAPAAQAMPNAGYMPDRGPAVATGTTLLAANTATPRNAARNANKPAAGAAKPIAQPAGDPAAQDWSAGTGSNGQWVIRNGRGPEHEIEMPDEKTAKKTARKLNKEEDKGEKRTEDNNNVRDDGSGPCGPNSKVQC